MFVFRYILTLVVPSSFRDIHLCRKAKVLSCSDSTVNLMFTSIEFRWCVKCSTSLSCDTVNVLVVLYYCTPLCDEAGN